MNAPLTPVALLILDGFGYRTEGSDNAILAAHKPNFDALWAAGPHTTISASEREVGLPPGQFGNSEVGHLNIGAGRVVQTELARIDVDLDAGTLGQNPVLASAYQAAKSSTLHILGLISDGGVHCHENHVHGLIADAIKAGVSDIQVHAFLDGRDTPPRSAETYLAKLEAVCAASAGKARIASIVGRYYAMDRDNRWDRVEPVYDLLTQGAAPFTAHSAAAGLSAAYARDENDEFVLPTVIADANQAPRFIQDGDVILFANYRADRAREITQTLSWPHFTGFERKVVRATAMFVSLTSYGDAYPHAVAYPQQRFSNGLGEYLSAQGLKQLRIAETEKYPHVTYFFSGGEETPYPGEDRILVPSPKVATYDLKPEMSAFEVTAKIEEAIASQQYACIMVNYANGDMVGHTGNFDAAVKAIEALDVCIGRVVAAMKAVGGEVLITADHGNAEDMFDEGHDQPHTQHTTNHVPVVYVGRPATAAAGGALRDIAPTLLTMMGLAIPQEMTGTSLVNFN